MQRRFRCLPPTKVRLLTVIKAKGYSTESRAGGWQRSATRSGTGGNSTTNLWTWVGGTSRSKATSAVCAGWWTYAYCDRDRKNPE